MTKVRLAEFWLFLGLIRTTSVYAAEPLAGWLDCRGIEDGAARLACFDRESAALDVKKTAAVSAPAAPPLDPKKEFGLSPQAVVIHEIAAGTRADMSTIEAHVLRFSMGVDGRAVFTLDNEQVWRQIDSTGEMLIKPGDTVKISRAALGSYWLQTPTGRGCKVSRLH